MGRFLVLLGLAFLLADWASSIALNGISHPGRLSWTAIHAASPNIVVNGEVENFDGSFVAGFAMPTMVGALEKEKNEDEDEKAGIDDQEVFEALSKLAAKCLFDSDLRRDAKGEHSGLQAASATNWINDSSAFELQKCFDRIKLKLAEERSGIDRDEASTWIRWMKSVPDPLIIEISNFLRSIGNGTITDSSMNLIGQQRDEFLNRLGCRLILLPSGAALQNVLQEPTASVIYGKLLYGGVTRYRLLESSNSGGKKTRQTGERTDIKTTASEDVPSWTLYGGPSRMYEAVDMGPAAVIELVLLPRGQLLSRLMGIEGNMVVSNILWSPTSMFNWVPDKNSDGKHSETNRIDFVTGLSGKKRNDAFQSDFQMVVGGLQLQIDAIVRRVLDGRVVRPAHEVSHMIPDETTMELSTAAAEAQELAALGLTPVRGLLLYGPPGTGKTLLARQISKALRARAPNIISAPELLDRWVGGSEKLVRALFGDAEAELAACNGDATKSALHVIVIDEIDAVFRRRSAGEDSGEATRASVVNQILAKLDGVNAIDNVLIVGMTNRRELLDEALLRPGRLEVQIKIPLPSVDGRREILNIHFNALRRKGRLSRPLCCAIDGVPNDFGSDKLFSQFNEIEKGVSSSDEAETTKMERNGRGRKRSALKRAAKRVIADAWSVVRPVYDLAADSNTGGFSGADIAGLVRNAGSIALSRARRDGSGIGGLIITLEDVKLALEELIRAK